MNDLKRWLSQATQEEKDQLADRAGTTRGALRVVAGAYYKVGGISLSPEFAQRLMEASRRIKRAGLAPMDAGLLSPVCKECRHYKKDRYK